MGFSRPGADGFPVQVRGSLLWTPTKRRVEEGTPDTVVLPLGFKVVVPVGSFQITAEPSGADWLWMVEENFAGLRPRKVYYAVPDVESIDYTQLTAVDPKTLQPVEAPEPAWYAYVEGLEATVVDAKDIAAGSLASAITAQGAAEASATAAAEANSTAVGTALAHANAALAQAVLAEASADEAGTSAFNAGASAASALGHRNTAAGFATDAGLSAFAADGDHDGAVIARAGAETARTGAEAARTGAETARTGAESAKTGAEAARDAAGTFHSTTIQSGLVDANGQLILTRNDDSTVDAGKVILPTTLTVIGTTTGPETAGATGAQGLKGDKGDPGGLAFGTDLGTADLNLIVTSGVYRQTNGTYTTTANNYPVVGGIGILTVMSTSVDNARFEQTFDPIALNEQGSGRVFYRRVYYAGTWYPWKAFTSTRVDNAAGRAIYQWDNTANREQLIYGDTGWRQFAANTPDFAGLVYVRRQTGIVTVQINVTPADATKENLTFATLPSGFRCDNPPGSMFYALGRQANSLKMTQLTVGSDGTLAARTATNNWVSGDGAFMVQASWPTSNTWPTTLPGTAVGTIPNL